MLDAQFYGVYPAVRRAAQVYAAEAVMAYAFASVDRADYEQEGLLAFWLALPKFDSSRASIRTFADRVVANGIASVVRRQRAVRRTVIITDKFAYSDGTAYSVELRADVQRVLAVLGDHDRRLARLLGEYSPSETSRLLGASRSSVYEGIRRIRTAFMAAGLASRSEHPNNAAYSASGHRQIESRHLMEGA